MSGCGWDVDGHLGLHVLFWAPHLCLRIPQLDEDRPETGRRERLAGVDPIINLWILVQCAGKEWWWILLLFIPLVNIVVQVIIWMAIAERRGKPSWTGILIIVPVVNIFMPGYFAFSK